jgi:predicted phosphohydrolase
MSLALLNPEAKVRLAMTHYPPIGADLEKSRASQILEQNKIDICVFGHLHNIKQAALFLEKKEACAISSVRAIIFAFNPSRSCNTIYQKF